MELREHNRKECLANTRSAVIRSIIDWIADESSGHKEVLWLYGLAGSGKSTLATTIAGMMRDLHRLGAFFFFDRDVQGRDSATLITMLAYQLAQFDPRIGVKVSQIVESIPGIAGMPLGFQFSNLLSADALKSVEWTGGTVVLVIDALDECGSIEERESLLQALSKGFQILPPFIRVIVVSRLESDIQRAFGTHPAVYPFSLDIESAANHEDISRFVEYRLDEIRKANPPLRSDWPGDDKVSALIHSARGLFVWASTACLYINDYDPDQRLNQLIPPQSEVNSPEHVNQQLSMTSSKPFARLDQLYKTGLESVGSWDNPSFRSDCCNIIGVILCAIVPVSCLVIDTLLELPPSRTCFQSISHLGCVLRIDKTGAVRILHPSFHDYLSGRCSTEPWSIDLQLHKKELALHCINLLNKTLRENIHGLTLPHWVQMEVLPEAVSYACRFWVEHTCLISYAADDVVDRIYKFLGRHLLHWMEAMAVLKSHDSTIRSLRNLLAWIQVCPATF